MALRPMYSLLLQFEWFSVSYAERSAAAKDTYAGRRTIQMSSSSSTKTKQSSCKRLKNSTFTVEFMATLGQ